MYWTLVNFILTANKEEDEKWQKLVDLRIAVGESLVGVLENSNSNTGDLPETLEAQIKRWTELNAFGGPSLSSQLKRVYQNSKNGGSGSGETTRSAATSAAGETEKEPAATASAAATTETKPVATATPPEMPSKPSVDTPQQRRSSFSQNNNTTVEEYDFESKVRISLNAVFLSSIVDP
ncbi:MAG: hypothetical protein SGARI_006000 [Bacillariaceae sp.]